MYNTVHKLNKMVQVYVATHMAHKTKYAQLALLPHEHEGQQWFLLGLVLGDSPLLVQHVF